jgi:dihydrofolate reductase
MSAVRYRVSVSLDGFAAGPEQSFEHPLGVRGRLLHEWMRESDSSNRIEHEGRTTGALIMGRNMFGGGPGPWVEKPEPWNGWWGADPPFHVPVFVLTHHPRPPLRMAGGTSFTFVHDGIDAALELARAAAGEGDIAIGGGATIATQYLAAGLVDEVEISLVPILLGGGVRVFDDPSLAGLRLEQTCVVEAPGVTHLRYRVLAAG